VIPSVKAESTVDSPELPESLPGIDLRAALKRTMGNQKLLLELYGDFRNNYAGAVGQIRQALEREDITLARQLAHTLKGVAGNLSIPDVFASARELETAIQQSDQAQIHIELDKLDKALQPVIESVARLAAAAPPPTAPAVATAQPPRDAAQLHSMLAELDEMLKKNSLSARKQFGLLQEQFAGADGELQTSLEQLKVCLGRLDFKAARKHLGVLAQMLGVTLSYTSHGHKLSFSTLKD
jgi:HPt (histidine-containing phosphotransfer) domain-containing protein